MKKTEKSKEKSYAIKVPVYTSELIEKPQDIFGGVTYKDMIDYVKGKINQYNEQSQKISRNKRNKVQKKEIDNVELIECNIGEVPSLLLKVSAYNTNLHDGYVEIEEKITLKLSNKLGSDNNFVLLYPNIIGINSANYKHQWLILIYEDPNKESTVDLIQTAKLVLTNILDIKIANIKLPTVLEYIKKIGTVPELNMKFYSIIYDDNEVDVKYRSYLVKSKLKRQKEDNFKNMPSEDTEEIINDKTYENDYQKREIKITIGKKEYIITNELQETQEKVNQLVEEIFNSTIGISETEIDSLYEKEFIISKLTPIITNYLSSDG